MTDSQRETLAAAMERVLPSGGGAGAASANAVGYADWLLRQDGVQGLELRLTAGVDLLDSLSVGLWNRCFAACPAVEQDAVLGQLQQVPHPVAQRFFDLLLKLTVTGFLCPPHYGGNREGLGWEYIGFVPHPFTSGAGVARAEP